MWIVVSFLILGLLFCSSACSADSLALSDKGRPLAAIVVSPDAIPAEQTAAKDLAEHLKLVTGAQFPIVSGGEEAPDGTRIRVGQMAVHRSDL